VNFMLKLILSFVNVQSIMNIYIVLGIIQFCDMGSLRLFSFVWYEDWSDSICKTVLYIQTCHNDIFIIDYWDDETENFLRNFGMCQLVDPWKNCTCLKSAK